MRSQARLRLHPPKEPEAVMLRVDGKPFRCHCGANVFTKADLPWKRRDVFVCNACHEWYEGT